MSETEAWVRDWDPLVARIGQDLFHLPEHRGWGSPRGEVIWGAEPIEAGTLRRWLEPLEYDDPIHHDRAAAIAAGHADIVVPVTALISFCFPPIWAPGGPPAFTSDGPDDQPGADAEGGAFAGFTVAPPGYTGYFGTDFEYEVIRPAVVGDWIGRHGSALLEVTPKRTGVGRGAFLRWEVEFVTRAMEPIARYRAQMFVYAPEGGAA